MKYLFNILIILMVSFVHAECSEIDNQEDCERVEGCEWIESDNMPDGGSCVEGEGDDEEDWEDCSEIDNQEDCERMERCEWSENAGCIEIDSDDEEDWEDCSEIDNQEDCERMDGCEWSDNGDCYGDDGGALENNYPLSYSLSQNYPNPFNPQTTINFSIAEPGKISLKIYDISGKEINNLINEFYGSGNYSIQWNGIDSYGNQLSSGIYIYQLTTKNGILSNSMILMK